MMHGNGWFGNFDYLFLGRNILSGWHYLIMIGIVMVVVALIIWIIRKDKHHGNQALSMLKELYVKGELMEEEYLKRKNVIERS